jgi:aminopeptidase
MEKMDAYIGVRGSANTSELSDVPAEKMDLYQRLWWQPVHIGERVRNTKWVVLRYPTPSMAQAARMSTRAFEDYFFDVCTADYQKMARDQEPLKKRMEAAKQVRLVGPGTDLEFSIADIPVVCCNGKRNIPDGEVFTAPVKLSGKGVIRFNTQSLYQGTVFDGIELELAEGRIVRATCTNEPDKLNQILDSDEGARYIGEWSIGCNNRVKKPMLDTLFDEKIGGSIHFTPGNAYDEADNGNRSRVHWDLVLIQTPEYGGGEIWFDGPCCTQRRALGFLQRPASGRRRVILVRSAAPDGGRRRLFEAGRRPTQTARPIPHRSRPTPLPRCTPPGHVNLRPAEVFADRRLGEPAGPSSSRDAANQGPENRRIEWLCAQRTVEYPLETRAHPDPLFRERAPPIDGSSNESTPGFRG